MAPATCPFWSKKGEVQTCRSSVEQYRRWSYIRRSFTSRELSPKRARTGSRPGTTRAPRRDASDAQEARDRRPVLLDPQARRRAHVRHRPRGAATTGGEVAAGSSPRGAGHACTPLTLACTELPSTIGNLKALEMLDVRRNSLQGEHLRSTRTTQG